MSRVVVTDEWLYKYMPIVDSAMLRAIESEVDYNYIFSENYERKMKKVIRQEARMWVGDFMRFARKAAVVVICILAALFALTMSVEAYRTKFFQTVKEIWEDSVIYTYFMEVGEESFQQKEPTYVPEGYEEIERFVTDDLFTIVYENESEEQIIWDQMLVTDGQYNTWDTQYETQIVKQLDNGILIISVYSDGYIVSNYECDKYIYILYANSISVEDAYKIYESIE